MVFHVYTIQQLAQEIGVDHHRVRTWVQRGKLAPTQKIGVTAVFDDEAVATAKRLRDGEGMGRLPHLYQRIPESASLACYLTKHQAAEIIGVDEATLARWVKAGRVKAYKPVGQERILFDNTDVARLVAERASSRAA